MAQKLKILYLLILAIFLAHVPSTDAQSSAGPVTGNAANDIEEDFISVSFQVYVRGRADYSDLYYFENPEKLERLEINYGQKSRFYEYTGLPEFGIFRRQAGPEGEPVYTEVASADLTDKGSELLFFLTPATNASDRSSFNLAVMNSVRESIAPGEIAFFNGTRATFQGILASNRFVIPPGLSDPISTSGIDTGEHVMLGLVVRYEGNFKVVLETNVRFVPNRRTLYVLMPPEKRDSFQITAFRMIEGE